MARIWGQNKNDKTGSGTTKIEHQSQKNLYLVTPHPTLLKIVAKKGSDILKSKLNSEKEMYLQYATWSEFEDECGASRVWGGVNFNDTITVSKLFGKQFAEDAVSYVKERVSSGLDDSSNDNYYYGKTLWPSLLFL